MRFPAIAALCLAALPLSGCAELQQAVDFIDAPATQQAVATVQRLAVALVCDISSGSALALAIEKQVGSHTGNTNLINVASTLVCQQLSGTVVGTVANVTAVTAVH